MTDTQTSPDGSLSQKCTGGEDETPSNLQNLPASCVVDYQVGHNGIEVLYESPFHADGIRIRIELDRSVDPLVQSSNFERLASLVTAVETRLTQWRAKEKIQDVPHRIGSMFGM